MENYATLGTLDFKVSSNCFNSAGGVPLSNSAANIAMGFLTPEC